MKSKSIAALGLMAVLIFPSSSFAAYTCFGSVNYLGLGGDGNLVVAVGPSKPNVICNVLSQGSFAMPVSVCKAAYASLVAARVSGKGMGIYYGDNGLTCETIPNWGASPTAYFVEGPL